MLSALVPALALVVTAASGMVRIPSGSYRPLYAGGSSARTSVAAFALDRDAVTRDAFLAFVKSNPAWRRGAVSREHADAGYLADWSGDVSPAGSGTAPVTGVSWFAAKAYCEWRGQRLPTVAEWEYAGAADATRRDASADPAFRSHLLAAYSSRHARPVERAGEVNVYGVRGMHDRVWEWTLDFQPGAGHQHGTHEHHAYCASSAIGASDPANYPAFLRNAVRSSLTPRSTIAGLGFRCAA